MITYQDHISTFQELLHKDNSVSIHHRNLQVLVTEMFKIDTGLSPDILREIFVPKLLTDAKFTLFIKALNRYPFYVQRFGI